MGQRHRARPLRCTGRRGDGSGGSGAAPALLAGPTFEALHCRTCWEEEDCEDGGQLVAPCACTGSMRMVHARCLAAWQQQLRASKGIAAARRCDVCKTAWLRAHQPEIGPTNWRQMLRDLGRKVPWAALLEFWRFSVLAVGVAQGMRAGVDGFRAGMRWATASSRHNIECARWLAQVSPDMVLAASAVPTLKVPVAFCLAAFVTGLAAQVALASLACAYLSTVAGFLQGTSSCLLATLSLGGTLLCRGTLVARTLARGTLCGAAAAGRLATPLVLGLLRTLALSRLFA